MKFQSYGREPGRTVAFANSNLILLSDRLLLSCFLFFVSFFFSFEESSTWMFENSFLSQKL